MKNILLYAGVVSVFIVGGFVSASAEILFYDDFNTETVDRDKWSMNFWDGQLGRTTFRTLPFPEITNGNAVVTVESYNPEEGLAGNYFYGADLKSLKLIPLKNGCTSIKIRAKMDTVMPGIVGGIFLFAFRPGSNILHDEIDFEFVTSEPDLIMTNSYSNEPLGPGQPEVAFYESGNITDYHLYEIKWESDKVSWFLDGKLIRVETEHVPAIPMEIHLNAWVTSSEWEQAYNPDFQPATTPDDNQIFGMSVDSIEVRTTSNLSPIFYLLLQK
ncbi:MAG: glycosyl hydrolase family protein [Candidatus Electrothrix sp. AUS1_2]|nr:glycosyl hydrolase family protein [Candidatus Electrothrix sp. AUS1_2]